MPADSQLYGLYGGTFDPIHYGHIKPICEVAQLAQLRKVTYLPSAYPPHRPSPHASAAHRVAMVRIALAGEDAARALHFEVDDLELQREPPSYTIDTLQSLKVQYPHRRYALILGLDALLNLETWHRWQGLRELVHIIAIARAGWQVPQSLPDWWQSARVESRAGLDGEDAGRLLFVEVAPVAISSTLVRARIRDGEGIADLLPRAVSEYIAEHNLYNEITE